MPASVAISQLAICPEKTIIRRPVATARSTCSKPRVSTRPPGSKTRIFPKCEYSAATRPRLSHIPAATRAISVLESSGKARLMLRRALGRGPPRPPLAEASAGLSLYAACHGTAEGGSAIERQKPEPAEQGRRSPGLQTIGEAGRPSGKVGRGRPCARDQLRNSGGNSFSAPQAEQVARPTATRCLGPIPDAITKPQLPQR